MSEDPPSETNSDAGVQVTIQRRLSPEDEIVSWRKQRDRCDADRAGILAANGVP